MPSPTLQNLPPPTPLHASAFCVAQNVQERMLRQCIERLRPHSHKTTYVRNYTSVAVHLIPDNLDFVYVDARHDFCGEGADLEQP